MADISYFVQKPDVYSAVLWDGTNFDQINNLYGPFTDNGDGTVSKNGVTVGVGTWVWMGMGVEFNPIWFQQVPGPNSPEWQIKE